jgi:Zn-dependent peptidase ImmA (M78 family)
MGERPQPEEDSPATMSTVDRGSAPERDAQDILADVWTTDQGVIPLPVDPIYIAQQLGLQVFTAGLANDVSGMLVKRPGEDAQIYINGSDSRNRQRFTCAHELGHYVKRSGAGQDAWSTIDYRSSLASQGVDADEIYANQFAAALLMPAPLVQDLMDRHGNATLAHQFGVSTDAMSFRRANLGL